MRSEHLPMIIFVGLLAGGCGGNPGTKAPERTPFEQAVDAIGGGKP